MMKLKGLLKGLFILGLTLLPISFSSADFLDVSCQTFNNQSTMVVYDNTILTFRNGNFTTNRLNNSIEHVIWLTNKNFVSEPSSNNSNLSSFFAWYNGNPYIFAGALGEEYQGFPQNVCVESLNGFDITTYGASMNCNSENINSFLLAGNINGGSICYPSTTNTYAYGLFTYCFYDNNYAYCFKITSYRNSPDKQVLTLSGTLNLPNRVNVSSLQAIEWSKSPFGYSPNTDNSSVVNPRDSAQNIYDAYRKKGYSDTLCYGGYELNNLFGTGNSSFDDIQIGRGASIFDLFNTYSGGLSFVEWYNQWDYNYWYFEQFRDSYEYEQYIGKSKGLIGAFLIKSKYFNSSNFDTATLQSFCQFSIANDTLIDKTQTPLDIISDTLDENEIHKLIGNIGVIIPNSGSALDIVAGTITDFSEDDFWTMLQTGYSAINSISYDFGDYDGILPTYIVVGFLLIFLLYVLKH